MHRGGYDFFVCDGNDSNVQSPQLLLVEVRYLRCRTLIGFKTRRDARLFKSHFSVFIDRLQDLSHLFLGFKEGCSL